MAVSSSNVSYVNVTNANGDIEASVQPRSGTLSFLHSLAGLTGELAYPTDAPGIVQLTGTAGAERLYAPVQNGQTLTYNALDDDILDLTDYPLLTSVFITGVAGTAQLAYTDSAQAGTTGQVTFYNQSGSTVTLLATDQALSQRLPAITILVMARTPTDTLNTGSTLVPIAFLPMGGGDKLYRGQDSRHILPKVNTSSILFGCTGATYGRGGTLVTVTSAAHGLTNAKNGSRIYLNVSTGGMSSGWKTGFTYIDANSFTCYDTVAGTISAGSLLAANTALTTLASVTVPANYMGVNGECDFSATFGLKSGLSSTTCSINFGALNVWVNSLSGVSNQHTCIGKVINENTTAIQRINCTPYGGGTGSTAVVPAKGSVDTAIDVTLAVTAQLSTGADWVSLETWSAGVTYSSGT
jgi:hypothetical protein